MNQLQAIKNSFRWVDDKPELKSYGQFRRGLTTKEIEKYIQARAGKLSVKRLIKKFNEIAGCNTMGIFSCEMCECSQSLMYRWDVERFADVLFEGKPTYFD